MVGQDPDLLRGPIRGLFGEVSDGEIWTVLEQVQIKQVVASRGGLDVCCVEEDNFSVGQTQLLSIACALSVHTSVLCLDECTSNVDAHTGQLVLDVLLGLPKSVTVLVISHGNGGLDCFDRVLRM